MGEATVQVVVAASSTVLVAFFGYLGLKTARHNSKALDTGNEKLAGEYIHDMAQLQEVMSAQLHTNTRELVGLSGKVTSVEDKVDDATRTLHAHLEDVAAQRIEYQREVRPVIEQLAQDREWSGDERRTP